MSGCILCSCSPEKPSNVTPKEIPATLSTNREATAVLEKTSSCVIGHLERREVKITIYTGNNGPLYSIMNKDGAVLADKINDQQLQAKYPELYRDLKTGIAGNDASLRDVEP
jgi:hypothetical protein